MIVGGSKTGRLLILKKGTVAIVKEDTEIAKVAEPGAVFGELSVLLDQPHTADVRALETSQFHVAALDCRSNAELFHCVRRRFRTVTFSSRLSFFSFWAGANDNSAREAVISMMQWRTRVWFS